MLFICQAENNFIETKALIFSVASGKSFSYFITFTLVKAPLLKV